MVIKQTAAATTTMPPPSSSIHHTNHTLPVPNPTVPYWRATPHPLDAHRSTPTLPSSTDILIIGAGMAGVSVAYHLLSGFTPTPTTTTSPPNQSPPPSILLLDARRLCSGATGRNGGHVKLKAASALSLIRAHGLAAAEQEDAFTRAHIAALKATVEQESGDGDGDLAAEAEFELRRSYDTFAADADVAWIAGEWAAVRRRGDAWARDRDLLRGEVAERVSSVRGARAAVSAPACSLWPYRFVMGLAERLVRRWERAGVLNVQADTPVAEVRRGPGPGGYVARTERGEVAARKVVFATNAYTAGLVPAYEGVITPFKGTCAHLAPPEGREKVFPHLSHTYNLEFGGFPGLETVDYLNPRPDGGVVVGGGKWLFEERRELWDNTVDDSTLIEPIMEKKYFEGYMQRTFRGWEDSGTEAERIWTGIMGRTPDGLPHVGKVPGEENQWILAGFNGGGMGRVFLSAKGIARMVLDDVPFEETGVGIPDLYKTTKERLEKRA